MPEVSRFFGIVIRMYFDEHNPPHFRALYAGNEAQVGINPIVIPEGEAPESCGVHGPGMGCASSTRSDAQLASIAE